MIVPLFLTLLAQNVTIVENAGEENGKQLTPIPDKVKEQFEKLPTVRGCDLINEIYEYLKAMIRRFVPKKFQYLGCLDMFFRTTDFKCEVITLHDEDYSKCKKLWIQYNCTLDKLETPIDSCNNMFEGLFIRTQNPVRKFISDTYGDYYRNELFKLEVDPDELCDQIYYFNNQIPELKRTKGHYAYIFDIGIKYLIHAYAVMQGMYGRYECEVDLNEKALTFFGLRNAYADRGPNNLNW